MKKVYVAVKAVVLKDNRFLIIKRGTNEDVYAEQWDIPGGKVDFGENPTEALKREVMEETGIKVEIIKPLDVWTFFKDGGDTQVIGCCLLTKNLKTLPSLAPFFFRSSLFILP